MSKFSTSILLQRHVITDVEGIFFSASLRWRFQVQLHASSTDAAARCESFAQMKIDSVTITAASSIRHGKFYSGRNNLGDCSTCRHFAGSLPLCGLRRIPISKSNFGCRKRIGMGDFSAPAMEAAQAIFLIAAWHWACAEDLRPPTPIWARHRMQMQWSAIRNAGPTLDIARHIK